MTGASGPALAFVLLVCCQRLAELALARHNTRRLLAVGGFEVGAVHYPLIVGLHAGWLGSMALLGYGSQLSPFWLIAYLGLQVGRVWTIASLGRRWTTRIIVVDAPAIRRGPYRWLRHPNYLVVAVELVIAPMVLDLPEVAAVFGGLNLVFLAHRIRVEDAAMAPLRHRP